MPYERNFRAVCGECDWQSVPHKFRTGAKADASRHNDKVYNSDEDSHVSAGATVEPIDEQATNEADA